MHLSAQCLTATFLLAMLATNTVQAAPRLVRVGVYENPPKLLAGPQGQPSGILGDLLGEMAEGAPARARRRSGPRGWTAQR